MPPCVLDKRKLRLVFQRRDSRTLLITFVVNRTIWLIVIACVIAVVAHYHARVRASRAVALFSPTSFDQLGRLAKRNEGGEAGHTSRYDDSPRISFLYSRTVLYAVIIIRQAVLECAMALAIYYRATQILLREPTALAILLL